MPDPTPPPAAMPVWRHLYWILAAAFCVRAGVALSGDFALHPDEIMQYLEPAHRAVFGPGLVFWEFHYGARSWLVPGLVAGILWVCKSVGLGEPAFYIPAVKLMFCAISLAIPAGMYAAGRRLYGERTGRMALVLGAFWYELVGFAHKPMTEFAATGLLLLLLALMLQPPQPRRAAAAAGLAVLTVAVRMQYAIVVGVLLAWGFLRSGKRARLAALLAGLAALAGIGVFDYMAWGGFFHSYQTNLLFNLAHDRSGESTAWHYLGWLTLASGGLFLATVFAGIGHWRRHLLLLALMLAVLLPHMAIDHREYRFVFAAIPIWLMVFADLLAEHWNAWKNSPDAPRRRLRPALGWGYAAVVSGLGILNLIPGQHHAYAAYSVDTKLVSFVFRQDPAFSVYRQLAHDSALCGVLDATQPWRSTPGYYYLHQPVPFYDNAYVHLASTLAADNLPLHVSHVIAKTAVPEEPAGIYRDSKGRVIIRIGDRHLPLPHIMIDRKANALVYMDATGHLIEIEGYALSERIGDISVWTAPPQNDRQGPCRVRAWANYTPFAGGTSKQSIRATLGADALFPEAGPQIVRP